MTGLLPPGWMWSAIGEVFTVNPPNGTSLADDSLVSFVPMPAVEAGTGRMNAGDAKQFMEVKKGLTPFIDGDLLFAKITPSMENGKIAVAKGLIGGIGFGSTEFHVARPHAGMLSDYLRFFLMQQAVRQEAKANMTGTAGQRRVPTDYFASLPLPLPPLAEQRRIVDEIDRQLTRLDAAVDALRDARTKLRRYRASVLNAAVAGRLVPTEAALARDEGRDYEHASALLERIARERAAQEQAKPRRKRPAPAPPDTSALPELPEGWAWSSVGQLAYTSTGATPLRSKQEFYRDGRVPWTTSTALNESEVRAPTKFVTERAVQEYNLSVYPPQTLLVAMYGEGRTRGKCSELLFPSTINQAITAIVMTESSSDCRQFAKIFLISKYLDTRRLSSGGVQPNLSLELIRRIAVPLPPLAEQQRIIAEVERRLSGIQQAEAAVEANLKRAERLRQAILKRAFEGRLVPQDPDDEPASALLERIKAEKVAAERARLAKAAAAARPRLGKAAAAARARLGKGRAQRTEN